MPTSMKNAAPMYVKHNSVYVSLQKSNGLLKTNTRYASLTKWY